MEFMKELEKRLLEKEERLDAFLKGQRDVVRNCSKAVKESQLGNYEKADELLEQAKQGMGKLEKPEFEHRMFAMRSEYAEALLFRYMMRDKKILSPEEAGVDDASYLGGLLDCMGELKRVLFDALRTGEKERAEEIFAMMEKIWDGVGGMHFSRALVPEFRRKQDVGRAMLEDARGKLIR